MFFQESPNVFSTNPLTPKGRQLQHTLVPPFNHDNCVNHDKHSKNAKEHNDKDSHSKHQPQQEQYVTLAKRPISHKAHDPNGVRHTFQQV
jgi:hypothetical protein